MFDFKEGSVGSPTADPISQLPPRALELFCSEEDPARCPQLKSLSIVSYSIGDRVLTYSPPVASEPRDRSNIYIVCKGRIRLLIESNQKVLTASLLEADRHFGADHSFIDHPFSYQAIAASETVELVQIPTSALVSALEIKPHLRIHWEEQVQIRERLIFFRAFTALRDYPSHQLGQWMPYLQVLAVSAGERLAAVTSNHAGRYWLRLGTVTGENFPPALGHSWGYTTDSNPTEIDPSWIAQTSLVLYHLPMSAWAIAKAFTPELDIATVEPLPVLSHLEIAAEPTDAATESSTSQQRFASADRSALAAANMQLNEVTQSSSISIFPKPPQRRVLDALRRYPWVEQQSSSDCGAACLSMIARYWGKRFPLNVLRERAKVGREGATLKSLSKAAESLGFQSRPVRASLGAIAKQRGPWIAHWEGNHYVVIYRVEDQRVLIADPALGRRYIPRPVFIQKWTGYGMLLEPTLQLQETEIKQGSLGRYVKALFPYRKLMVQIIVISLLIQCFGLLSPLFTQVILDRVVVQKSTSTLNVFVIGLLIFGLWGIGMGAVRQYLLSYFSNRLDVTLISGFIRHTMSLPMQFFESRRVGDIVTRVQENQKIQQFLIGQVVLAWLSFLTGFVYLGLMLYYNWKLTALVLLMLPPIVITTLCATPFLRKISREVFKEAADQNSALVEMVGGAATLKSTATEHDLRWRWENNLTRLTNARFRGQKFGIGLQSVSGTINSIGSTLLLWYGATLVIQEQLTIGQFVAFNMMIGYVINPVLSLVNLWDELQEIFISIERLNDVFEAKSEEEAGENLLTMPEISGTVAFESVTFRYSEESDRNTLQNISFKASAGSTTAIVGRSGSGKSTLVKLLEGLYHPQKGRVLIDGHDIRHISPASLRSQIGVVPQDCVLFSGTIFENICLFRDDISLDAVVRAAKLAEAHSFIQALPLGYSTAVGERGATLSGGQRQRIAIARALLRQPRLLILDEATSSLDAESERHFQQNLERISTEGTAFIIAHRLSTVRNADRILVLDRGVLVEQGSHSELIEKKGLYHSLAQQQLDL